MCKIKNKDYEVHERDLQRGGEVGMPPPETEGTTDGHEDTLDGPAGLETHPAPCSNKAGSQRCSVCKNT